MHNIDELKKEIIQRLRPIDPEQVIIFGSYAQGTSTVDSDLDLYVVTKDGFIPQSYQEKRELVRKISRQINDLRLKMSIDLLVHTHAMNKRFYSLNSSFARDIQEKGMRLL
jgi:predicted nucleotidyltransferase